MAEYPTRLERELTRLGTSIDALATEHGWNQMLGMVSKFHRYSLNNQILIAIQRPDATYVAGYRTWQHLGRQVRKAERSIRIIAPSKTTDDQGEDRLRFRTVGVFDISQTYPVEDGTLTFVPPSWPRAEPCSEGLANDILRMARDAELTLRWTKLTDGSRGYLDRANRVIVVDQDLDTSDAVTTVLHELGHWFDPGLDQGYRIDDGTRAQAETVAESAAWVMCSRLGIEHTMGAGFYLHGWTQGAPAEMILAVFERIRVAVEGIEALVVALPSIEEVDA